MSTKPKGVVVYSANELNHFYIKGDGSNTEMLIGHETTADDTVLPLYIQSNAISIMRGVSKVNLQTTLSTIETEHAALVADILTFESAFNDEVTRATAAETANATAITTEQTRALAAESAIQTSLDGAAASLGATLASLDTAVTNNYNEQQSDNTAVNNAITALTTSTTANLTAEEGRALAAEATLGTDIATNATDIAAEETRALAAEAGLQSQITNLLSNTDGTALNSLAELVADYNASGASYTAALNAQISAYTTKMAILDAQIATLQQQVDDLTNPPE